MPQEQYKADAESWSSEQAALQANLAALAAQTALKSLALDAMMRNNRAGQAAGGHAIGGPLWQQVWSPAHHLELHGHWLMGLTRFDNSPRSLVAYLKNMPLAGPCGSRFTHQPIILNY